MACSVSESVGIAAAEVDDFHVAADAGKENVVGLQVEVEHLMIVQIANDIGQLAQELVGVLPVLKVVGSSLQSLRERLTVDIVHEDAIVGVGDVTWQTGMLQLVACLELLAQSLPVAYISSILWFEPLQEMELAI